MKSTPEGEGLPIGALAARFGLPAHVLRHWESVGLPAPERLPNGQRRYRRSDLFRVAFIQQGKELGFSLREISTIVAADDLASRRAVLDAHRMALEERIASAQAAKQIIEHALSCPNEDFFACSEVTQAIAQRIPATE